MGSCGTADIDLATPPLIVEWAQAIIVCESADISGEHLIFGNCSVYDYTAGGEIINIVNCCGCRTGNTFSCPMKIGIRHHKGHKCANIEITKNVGAASCSSDIATVTLPLIVEWTKAIIICKCADICNERLIFANGSGYDHITSRSVVKGSDRNGNGGWIRIKGTIVYLEGK